MARPAVVHVARCSATGCSVPAPSRSPSASARPLPAAGDVDGDARGGWQRSAGTAVLRRWVLPLRGQDSCRCLPPQRCPDQGHVAGRRCSSDWAGGGHGAAHRPAAILPPGLWPRGARCVPATGGRSTGCCSSQEASRPQLPTALCSCALLLLGSTKPPASEPAGQTRVPLPPPLPRLQASLCSSRAAPSGCRQWTRCPSTRGRRTNTASHPMAAR
jgi:hypothetical protein